MSSLGGLSHIKRLVTRTIFIWDEDNDHHFFDKDNREVDYNGFLNFKTNDRRECGYI